MNRRLFALITCLALAIALTGTSGVAVAAPKKAKDTSWRGLVRAAGDDYVYEGRPCPEKAETCATVVVRYLIKADTGTARRSLGGAVGHDTRLKGRLAKSKDPQYEKVLVVKKVTVVDEAEPSAVMGKVTIDDACPSWDEDCGSLPAGLDLHLLRRDGSLAASGRSGDDGNFRIPAPAGSYVLRADVDPELVDCPRLDVEIDEGRFTRTDMRCEAMEQEEPDSEQDPEDSSGPKHFDPPSGFPFG